jgi:multiple sugar transport system substrate-binding protein
MAAALAGHLDRRDLFRRGAALGFSATTLGALAHFSNAQKVLAEEGVLKVTFYDWIINLHRPIRDVNADFNETFPIDDAIAPVEAANAQVFIAEARDGTSTWDVYLGQTPFAEMSGLIEANVIEPWDSYMPEDVKNDIIPSILQEGTVDGQVYGWPFLLDIIVQGWNADIVERAGLDPETAPETWDEYLAAARAVKDSGAAPFGCTFDRGGWRSLAPITHSISTDVYTEDGFFDFTHDAVVEALEIMKQMVELANPDVMNPGTTDGGINGTPDEGAWSREQVGYYVKYQNAHLRFTGSWQDPTTLRLAALPSGGAGGTVFWTTGAALLKHGSNKQAAADYMVALTHDERVWQSSIGGGAEGEPPVGQLPVYVSLWDQWEADRPEWLADWALLVRSQLDNSRAIMNNKFGFSQFFTIGDQHWHRYLTGEESDPRKALQDARDAVIAEAERSG